MIRTPKLKVFFIGIMLFNASLAADIWISDEIEAPLRKKPETSAEIVTLLPAGIAVQLLKKSPDGNYVEIKTVSGETGWLSSYYVLDKESAHSRLSNIDDKVQKLNEKISRLETELLEKNKTLSETQSERDGLLGKTGDLTTLQQQTDKLSSLVSQQNDKIKSLSSALTVAEEKANEASVKYLSLVKISKNAPEIESQNQTLHEQNLEFEREMQLLRNENVNLKANTVTNERWQAALLIFGGLFVGYILSILHRRKIRYG